MVNILFVCSSNICRSPYCEFVFKRMVENDEVLKRAVSGVSSAAVLNFMGALHKKAYESLLREGFDKEALDKHRSRHVLKFPELVDNADVIIGMTKWHKWFVPRRAKKKYINLSEATGGAYKAIPDPFLAKTQEDYNAAMDVIKGYLRDYAEKLKADMV